MDYRHILRNEPRKKKEKKKKKKRAKERITFKPSVSSQRISGFRVCNE